jgi:hypothetical protein
MSSTMASSHVITPEFPFFLLPDNLPSAEDYTTIWSDFTANTHPSAVQDPFLGSPVSMVSGSGYRKVTHVSVSQNVCTANNFGNETNLGATFSNVDVVPYTTRDIYLEDLLEEAQQVSIQRFIIG